MSLAADAVIQPVALQLAEDWKSYDVTSSASPCRYFRPKTRSFVTFANSSTDLGRTFGDSCPHLNAKPHVIYILPLNNFRQVSKPAFPLKRSAVGTPRPNLFPVFR